MQQHTGEQESCSGNCACRGGLRRRDFLRMAGAGALGALTVRPLVMAGPFEASDFGRLIPADKKLHPDWVQSLFARGAPAIYRGKELKWIGMPVGGLCAGQLYLGGDGKLWHWDIFNQYISTDEAHYAYPPAPASPLEQGFALKLGEKSYALDHTGFSEISFCGQYPLGMVEYKDAGVPLAVTLEAFSPFIPLNTDDSSLPATIMQFTLRNTSNATVEATLVGSLENAVCLHHRFVPGTRCNRIVSGEGFTFLECAVEKSNVPVTPLRPDIVFEDWHQGKYDGWTVAGTAFGASPIKKSAIPAYQGNVGGDTEYVVNSHATAPAGAGDAATGRLTSRRFLIERNFINFWIGGGDYEGSTCLSLVVDGKVVQSATGKRNNQMTLQMFDVRILRGQQAYIEIVDEQQGAWGNIGVGKITFSDQGALEEVAFADLPDLGTMGLALLGAPAEEAGPDAVVPMNEKLVGRLGRRLKLSAGQSATVTFAVAWCFPNLVISHTGLGKVGRDYAIRFDSALSVAGYVVANFDRLAAQTRLWRDTWYDSTLPFWFLDRTQLNTSILATSTCFRLASGRFWAWEGVGCCAGTCAHVWHYAHAMARQFPELERILRERTDFGLALQPDGAIHFRGENNDIPAIDAQAGSILRALREHQMSADAAFLKRIWPRVKRATEWLINKDDNNDGLIEGNQHNTLDTDWFGPVAWLSGLYLAALAAAASLADEMDDAVFADKCRAILTRGRARLVAELFNGEYFFNEVDVDHLDAINSGTGCEIDQVMGQSWAFQVGLPRVLPEKETKAALQSLWKYNFAPDVGPYRERNKPGRWYALAGEAGLLMCTFPCADWDYIQAAGQGPEWAAGYFNECMNGFEYQVAGHMLWEGLLLEGLAITRAVHDRYHASRRNPWNEVECGDHYARSMASYGVFLAACGYEYHGPRGHLGFAPRLAPENFKAPFTVAEGWGTYAQQSQGGRFQAQIMLKWGKLHLRTLALAVPEKLHRTAVSVTMNGQAVDVTSSAAENRLTFTLACDIELAAGQTLAVEIG